MDPRARLLVWATALATLAAACGGEPSTSAPSKDDLVGGKADGIDACASAGLEPGCDPCAELGWYGDGVCDDRLVMLGICAGPDPDCGLPDRGCTSDDECLTAAGAFCLVTHFASPAYSSGECTFRDGFSCSDDDDCGPRARCVPDCGMGRCAGFCVSLDGCETDSDCPAGQECSVACEWSPEDGSPVGCRGECRQAGSSCDDDGDCAAGSYCAPWFTGEGASLGSGACRPGDCLNDGRGHCWDGAGAVCVTVTSNETGARRGECRTDAGYCASNADCGPGAYCAEDCSAGYCYYGMCMPVPGCGSAEDCADGQVCSFRCPTDPRLPCTGECRPAGSACNVDADCPDFAPCRPSCSGGSCAGACGAGDGL